MATPQDVFQSAPSFVEVFAKKDDAKNLFKEKVQELVDMFFYQEKEHLDLFFEAFTKPGKMKFEDADSEEDDLVQLSIDENPFKMTWELFTEDPYLSGLRVVLEKKELRKNLLYRILSNLLSNDETSKFLLIF